MSLDVFDFDDSLPISLDSEDLKPDSDVYRPSAVVPSVQTLDGFAYPALVLSDILFNDTFRVLSSLYHETWKLVDVWVEYSKDDPPVKQGKIPLDIKTLLAMRYLGIKGVLYGNEETVIPLDLDDPDVLESFI